MRIFKKKKKIFSYFVFNTFKKFEFVFIRVEMKQKYLEWRNLK